MEGVARERNPGEGALRRVLREDLLYQEEAAMCGTSDREKGAGGGQKSPRRQPEIVIGSAICAGRGERQKAEGSSGILSTTKKMPSRNTIKQVSWGRVGEKP